MFFDPLNNNNDPFNRNPFKKNPLLDPLYSKRRRLETDIEYLRRELPKERDKLRKMELDAWRYSQELSKNYTYALPTITAYDLNVNRQREKISLMEHRLGFLSRELLMLGGPTKKPWEL